ncbi:hypothetical protein [Flavobacterium sp.]|uniref:hypothetical protein n=1 Tax=Flavobacterium sp. TaxID=239 RepID=UPI0037537B6B
MIKKLAAENYKWFCNKDGSDYIASEYALEVILKIIKKYKIKNILEIGLGIGSISDTIFKYSNLSNNHISYSGTEKNEFCLKALINNVEDFKKLNLYNELKDIPKKKFDLIIIDGYDDTLKDVVAYSTNETIIFIEGDRKGQTDAIINIFPNSRSVNVITLNKNKEYAHGACEPSTYIGGGQLIFVNPNFYNKLYWFKLKLKTFTKRQFRQWDLYSKFHN